MKINTDVKKNPRDPERRGGQLDMWARQIIKRAGKKKAPVYDYIPHLHNPEPMYRPGSQDAFRCPSLINGKRIPYWGYIQEAVA